VAGKNNKSITDMMRGDLAYFEGYSAGTSPDVLKEKIDPEDIIKLDANENLYGCSPKVRQALADFKAYHIYPDVNQTEIKQVLAEYTGVAAENIVSSSGSSQLIDLIIRLFISWGDEVINCPPSFGIYPFSTSLSGGKIKEVPRDDGFDIDIAAVKKAVNRRTKLIIIANPNNPTGTLTPHEDIVELMEIGLPLVVDEAYYEYSKQTVVPLVGEYPNLMVLRTLSKWAGTAGLRFGYGVFTTDIARRILSAMMPYSVNVAAQVAANESLKDLDYLNANVEKINKERDRLFGKLNGFSWLKPYPSQANFIWCYVSAIEAIELNKRLEEKGILVRHFNTPDLKDFLRISVGKPQDSDILERTLREIGGD
jgi:histidinol-phosphate aminotransferase